MDASEQIEINCFHNSHLVAVDSSHRIMLPSKWRTESGLEDFVVLLWPVAKEEYLLVLTPQRWQKVISSFAHYSLSNEKAAIVERVLSSTSQTVRLDRYGRLPLPESMVAKVGIRDKAKVIGRTNKFEIWPPDLWDAREKDTKLFAYDYIASMNL
jgi:MraZ protein